MKLHPFLILNQKSDGPRLRLLIGVGVSYGQRGAPAPAGYVAVFLWRWRYLARRTPQADGGFREHWRTKTIDLEVDIGKRVFRVKVWGSRLRWPQFEVS